MSTLRDRAFGALTGLGIGDALGMSTQMLSRDEVRRLFGELRWFAAGPAENWISAGHPAGEVTDDTEQAMILAQLLVEGEGHVDPHEFVKRLMRWAEKAERDGSEQLGPSSRQALEAIANGAPIADAGHSGTTNGAAMRIAPVGVAAASADIVKLVDLVEEVCVVTHNTGLAIAGAAAVAAAVSAGIDGADMPAAIAIACEASELGSRRGHYAAGADVTTRIRWAVSEATGFTEDSQAMDFIYRSVGTGVDTQEAVPAAFALAARFPTDPWAATLAAANLGGDADTVGAITGAIVGAQSGPAGFPDAALELVCSVNDLDFAATAAALLNLRTGAVLQGGAHHGD